MRTLGVRTIYTLGHSTRSAADLLALLREHGMQQLVDVRRFPKSRRYPQFSRERLEPFLERAGIRYAHEPDMGGRRSARPDSPNTAWRVGGFRAYADHMETPEFRVAFERLIRAAGHDRVAIMCAEAVPWRCHRQLISDLLVSEDWTVVHVLGPGRVAPHELNPRARKRADGTLVYPASEEDQGVLDL